MSDLAGGTGATLVTNEPAPAGGGGGGSFPAKPIPDDTNYWLRSLGDGVANGAEWSRIRDSNVLPDFNVTVAKTGPNGNQSVYERGDTVTAPSLSVSYSGTPPAVTSASAACTAVGGAQPGDANTVVFNPMVAPYTSATSAGGFSRRGTDLGADPQQSLSVTASNGSPDTGATPVTFGARYYVGPGVAGGVGEAFIEALVTQYIQLSTNRARNTALAFGGVAQRVHYCEPARVSGTPSFKDQATQFDVPMTLVESIAVTNAFGFTCTIDHYQSDNPYDVDFTLQVQ